MTYNPAAVPLGALTLPNNGDKATAESVNAAFQPIADGVKYLGRRAIIAECSAEMPNNVVTTDTFGFTTQATMSLIANLSLVGVVKDGDIIHFSCTFNAKMSGADAGWLGMFFVQKDASNNDVIYSTQCNYAYVEGNNASLRQFTIQGTFVVSVDSTLGWFALYGRSEGGSLSVHHPQACTWTHMRTL